MSTTVRVVGFQPGERVPETGVYQVTHAQHLAAPQLVFESGKKFPLCSTCFWSVRYVLISHGTPQNMTGRTR